MFPMLWKEAEVVNLDIQLDRIDRCHGLVKNNSNASRRPFPENIDV